MTLDARARRAAHDFRRAVEDMNRSAPERSSFEGFERNRRRRQRDGRIGTAILAVAISALAIAFLIRTVSSGVKEPATPSPTNGRILYGLWNPKLQEAHWFTVLPDGTDERDLHVTATCAVWYPDGSKILITNDAALGRGTPLRPASINPDGTGLRRLDAARNQDQALGCGDVSPDGKRIALEGFDSAGGHDLDGIYSVRASDGGGLVPLLKGPFNPPRYSPDGTRLVFQLVVGHVNPTGAGALFVMNADGTDIHRITPLGYVFDNPAWSPDGQWIAFQKPYGQLFLIHPDGSGLHRIPAQLPAGMGAQNPSWSPDGSMIVFSLQGPGPAGIYVVSVDGTGLREVIAAKDSLAPSWGQQPA